MLAITVMLTITVMLSEKNTNSVMLTITVMLKHTSKTALIPNTLG
jgi:hypothetical protein